MTHEEQNKIADFTSNNQNREPFIKQDAGGYLTEQVESLKNQTSALKTELEATQQEYKKTQEFVALTLLLNKDIKIDVNGDGAEVSISIEENSGNKEIAWQLAEGAIGNMGITMYSIIKENLKITKIKFDKTDNLKFVDFVTALTKASKVISSNERSIDNSQLGL